MCLLDLTYPEIGEGSPSGDFVYPLKKSDFLKVETCMVFVFSKSLLFFPYSGFISLLSHTKVTKRDGKIMDGQKLLIDF